MTDGAVVINSMSYSRSMRSRITSRCNRPKKPQRKPFFSSSGSLTMADEKNADRSSIEIKSLLRKLDPDRGKHGDRVRALNKFRNYVTNGVSLCYLQEQNMDTSYPKRNPLAKSEFRHFVIGISPSLFLHIHATISFLLLFYSFVYHLDGTLIL